MSDGRATSEKVVVLHKFGIRTTTFSEAVLLLDNELFVTDKEKDLRRSAAELRRTRTTIP